MCVTISRAFSASAASAKASATAEHRRDIGPVCHSLRVLDFKGVVIEITEAVERFALRMDANDLMTGSLARRRDDLDGAAQGEPACDGFDKASALNHGERATR